VCFSILCILVLVGSSLWLLSLEPDFLEVVVGMKLHVGKLNLLDLSRLNLVLLLFRDVSNLLVLYAVLAYALAGHFQEAFNVAQLHTACALV